MHAYYFFIKNSCKLNLKTASERLTPLHIAVHEGYSVMVECLVGCGARLNEVTSDGNTVLHLAINRKNMRPPSDRTPQLQEVCVWHLAYSCSTHLSSV